MVQDKQITPLVSPLAGPLVLMILDGWGCRKDATDNAISQAVTPNWDKLLQHGTHTSIEASGDFVGLPAKQMGNSEVGHMNIGAGRVVFQNLTRIINTIGPPPNGLRKIDNLLSTSGWLL